jgi:hypothetical protein
MTWEIECVDPAGLSVRAEWPDIVEIAIVTNDSGPIGIDVRLELRTPSATCRAPLDAPGGKKLLFDDLRAHFPNMNFRAITAAMSSATNAEFIVWRRDA